jgi:urea transport system permease protein
VKAKKRRFRGRFVAGHLPRLVGLILLLLAPPMSARADDFSAFVGNLIADSFADKEKAVIALGGLGDPRAVPVLQALSDGRLFKSADGRVVVSATDGGTTRVRDAVTGDEITGADPDAFGRIIVNNRLRGAIEGALGALTLFSADPAARLTAAQDALRHPSAAEAALLEKAIAAEKYPQIRAAMQQGLAAARLVSGSKEERLAAIHALGTTTDPQIRNLLDEFRAAPDTDPELQKAADAALASIGDRLRLVGIAANLFQGVSLGSVLLLAAIGLAITFGVMDRRLSLGLGAGGVSVRGSGGCAAGAQRDPFPLWPAARDSARDLGRQLDPAAGGALDIWFAQQGSLQP